MEQEERQQIETIYWAGVLIWAGLVFVADNQDWLPKVGEAGPWSWIFFGAGLYGTLGNNIDTFTLLLQPDLAIRLSSGQRRP
jgi:hypothetical protein